MSPAIAKSTQTLPLTVQNTGFLLDRLGEDCHPLQFLRELTQNAIEAIQRVKKDGQIVWDVEWTKYELDNIFKLCIVDTGDGMTGEEMVQYINQLSSSFREQSMAGNYGVGAKIAAATRNHAGLVYMSWKGGHGSMIHLWRDPQTFQYGLMQFKRPDGTYEHHAEVEDSLKPEIIGDHGTMIVLLGHTDLADTMKAPENSPAPSRWIAKYLNSRYFKIPKNITIKAREGWEHPRSDKDRNLLRKIVGQFEYLQQHSEAEGSVEITDAVAHWWILKDETAISQNSGFIESSGHIAALYKDELYESLTARAGRARLQQFGVLFGHNRVVIYVEPKTNDQTRLTTNTARTQLLVNSEPLPWTQWSTDFREKMPKEIEILMQQLAAASSEDDHSSTIRDRLKQILDLFKVSRYRAAPTGDLRIDEDRVSRGGLVNRSERPRDSSGAIRAGGGGGTAGSLYSLFLKADGVTGTAVRPDVFPEVTWVSVKNGTREIGDFEDRAARFVMNQNRLLINADFRAFTDMVNRWVKQFEDRAAVYQTVEQVVHTWFEQALVETVIGVQALKDAKEWSVEDIEKALSEEALTAAVMQRYHVNNNVKREIGAKLGKMTVS
ncbi:MAG TPA: hypothetical protein VES96_00540 [Nitrospiraceae bacterium]|nr:hypothetical protein [Nitrospiraceae bacterium]